MKLTPEQRALLQRVRDMHALAHEMCGYYMGEEARITRKQLRETKRQLFKLIKEFSP